MLCRPILPACDITTIRRLSARVNVLPVIARADTLTADRLNAVKMAVRRDLAEAGIGFGIFDLDIPLYAQLESKVTKNKSENGFMKHHMNGNGNSPPSTPITPTLLRLPFSLISPDIYSHSDGVGHPQLSRHELMHQYDPSKHVTVKNQSTPKTALGRFVRTYRWGSLDVMDASHCEFLHLRGAVFHHMEVNRRSSSECPLSCYLLIRPTLPADVAKVHTGVLIREVQGRGATSGAPALRSPDSTACASRQPPATDAWIPPYPRHRNFASPCEWEWPCYNATLGYCEWPWGATTLAGSLGCSAGGALAEVEHVLQSVSFILCLGSPPMSFFSLGSQRQRAKKITVACNFCRCRFQPRSRIQSERAFSPSVRAQHGNSSATAADRHAANASNVPTRATTPRATNAATLARRGNSTEATARVTASRKAQRTWITTRPIPPNCHRPLRTPGEARTSACF